MTPPKYMIIVVPPGVRCPLFSGASIEENEAAGLRDGSASYGYGGKGVLLGRGRGQAGLRQAPCGRRAGPRARRVPASALHSRPSGQGSGRSGRVGKMYTFFRQKLDAPVRKAYTIF